MEDNKGDRSAGGQLMLSSNDDVNTYQTKQELNISEDVSLTLTSAYHLNEIQQNQLIINTAKGIIWTGCVIICIGIILALCGKTNAGTISVVSGIITEFISGIIFTFVTMSNKNKWKYFQKLSISEEGDKLLKMIMNIDNKKAREKLVDKMVTNYCEIRKSL